MFLGIGDGMMTSLGMTEEVTKQHVHRAKNRQIVVLESDLTSMSRKVMNHIDSYE